MADEVKKKRSPFPGPVIMDIRKFAISEAVRHSMVTDTPAKIVAKATAIEEFILRSS